MLSGGKLSRVLGATIVLAGCQVQHTTVMEQSTMASAATRAVPVQAAPPFQPSSPCAAPPGSGPFERLPRPVSGAQVPLPPKAAAEHVGGCAGVRFRLGADGAPREVSLMAEYPVGYGFGEASVRAVSLTRWPARDDMAWRYVVFNIRADR